MSTFCWLVAQLVVLVVVVEATDHYGKILLSGPRLLQQAPYSKDLLSELNKLDPLYMKFLQQGGDRDLSATGNISATCLQHLNITFLYLSQGKPWALQFLDSTGKIPSGLFLGDLSWMGTFDECVNTTATVYLGPNNTDPSHPFEGQYCKVGIPLSNQPAPAAAVVNGGIQPGSLQIGLCVPSSCSSEDVKNAINGALALIPMKFHNMTLKANAAICQKTSHDLDARAIVSITLLSILGFFVVIGTVYDVFVIHKMHANPEFEDLDRDETAPLVSDASVSPDGAVTQNIRYRGYNSIADGNNTDSSPERNQIQHKEETGLCGKILVAFSLYTNGTKLLSTKTQAGSLGAVNGVRFISMSWVILGHTYAFSLFNGKNVLPFVTEHVQRFSFLTILNATVSVDSFFLLSGLLVSYLSLKEMKNVGGPRNFRWVMFYFHRFWRLTPTYGLVLLLYIPLTKYLNDGPFWPDDGTELHYCDDNWWMNLLYINNLFPSKDTCMAWGWYMANDMQFYVLSPLLLVPLFINQIFGGLVCMAFLATTFTTTGLLVSLNHLPSNFLGLGGDPAKAGDFFDDYYVKPYCRIGPYIVGIIYGYILYKTNCKKRLNVCYNLFGWLVAAVCCLSALYGNYRSVEGKHTMSQGEAALYTAVVPTVWSVGVGWVVYACAVGSGGIVNGFLSWKLFIPLSRLTYISYLIHPVIMLIFYGSTREPFYFTDFYMVYYFLGHLVLANATAFVLSLVFESPFMGLEKALFHREKRH